MGKRYLRKAIKNKNKKIHLLPFFLGNKADLCDFARFLFLFRFIKIHHYKRSLSATNSAFLKCLCSFCICILMVVKPPRFVTLEIQMIYVFNQKLLPVKKVVLWYHE